MDGHQQLLFGKTCQGSCQRKTMLLDASSQESWGSMRPLSLKKASGIKQAFSVEKPSEWVIESSTPSTLGWLRGVEESFSLPCLVSLSKVLESGPVHQKYFLSEKACSGILRRAERRGKALPEPLRQALQAVAGASSDQESGCSTQAVAFTKAKRAQSNADDESWVQGDVAPTQNQFDVGDTRATTVVAFTQNARDEVRQINGDGQIAGALSANSGMNQTNYLAFKESQSGTRLGDVHATIDANKGSRRVEGIVAIQEGAICENPSAGPDGAGVRDDGVSYTLEARTVTQAVAFAQNQLGEVRTNDQVMGTVNTNQNASGRNTPMVHQAMQVRRLTPTECEFLQGFPAGYTDVVYRNKPAADGPRYRALGNSMAVPCMWWAGDRIRKATQ